VRSPASGRTHRRLRRGAVEDAGDLVGVEAEPAGDGVGVQALVVRDECAADFRGGKGFGGAGLYPSGFGDPVRLGLLGLGEGVGAIRPG